MVGDWCHRLFNNRGCSAYYMSSVGRTIVRRSTGEGIGVGACIIHVDATAEGVSADQWYKMGTRISSRRVYSLFIDTFLLLLVFFIQKGYAFINGYNLGRYWPAQGPVVNIKEKPHFVNFPEVNRASAGEKNLQTHTVALKLLFGPYAAPLQHHGPLSP